jgi:Transposase
MARRRYSPEFRADAVKFVVESSRTMVNIAGHLDIHPMTLGNWVRKEQAGVVSSAGVPDAPAPAATGNEAPTKLPYPFGAGGAPTNRLLRQYLPKKTSMAHYAQKDLNAIAHQLNTRRRKTLGYQTPAARLIELLH